MHEVASTGFERNRFVSFLHLVLARLSHGVDPKDRFNFCGDALNREGFSVLPLNRQAEKSVNQKDVKACHAPGYGNRKAIQGSRRAVRAGRPPGNLRRRGGRPRSSMRSNDYSRIKGAGYQCG